MFPYSTMLQPIFWMIIGLLTGVFVIGLRYWLKDLNISMNWWKWALLSFWLVLLAVTLCGSFTLMGENEWTAGYRFLLFFGSVITISGAGLWMLLRRVNP